MSKIENMFNVLANGTIEVNKIEIRGHVAFGSILKNNNKADGLKLLLYIYLRYHEQLILKFPLKIKKRTTAKL